MASGLARIDARRRRRASPPRDRKKAGPCERRRQRGNPAIDTKQRKNNAGLRQDAPLDRRALPHLLKGEDEAGDVGKKGKRGGGVIKKKTISADKQKVIISKEVRNKKKAVTSVEGLETFSVKLKRRGHEGCLESGLEVRGLVVGRYFGEGQRLDRRPRVVALGPKVLQPFADRHLDAVPRPRSGPARRGGPGCRGSQHPVSPRCQLCADSFTAAILVTRCQGEAPESLGDAR